MSYIKGFYKVIIAGLDVTNKFRPLLTNISVEKAAGEAADSANITLSDIGGVIALPPTRAPVQIILNGILAFEGFVTETPCSIDKSGGRALAVSCSSQDQAGKSKQPTLKHKDDASLSSVAQEFGSKADISVQVLGSIASVQRKYWIMQNESFVSWGQRVAREVGGTFKVVGEKAFLVGKNEGISASGKPLTPIIATAGANLLSGEITPVISRPKYSEAATSYFDIKKGEKVEVKEKTPVKDAEAIIRSKMSFFDEDQAKEYGKAMGKDSDREQGAGNIKIVGDATAEPEAICNVVGWRPGVDGSYRIDTVSHSVSKSGGFTTSVGLKQPQGGAGQDGR